MSEQKKCIKNTVKNKFISKESQDFGYLKDTQKNKKTQNQSLESAEEESDIPKLIGQYQACKGKKRETNVETCKELRQKVLDIMRAQSDARNISTECVLKSLTDLIMQFESDCNVMIDNKLKLDSYIGAVMKCIQQSTAAHLQKLKILKDTHASFKKECEDMEANHNIETNKLDCELKEYIEKLQENLICESKRKHMEILRESIKAMQNDF